MNILIACEYSGIVRDAFLKKGHEVISCDLLPTETKGPHYQGDVLDILYNDWDMIIAFPPCTYLCSSGLHWNKRRPEREKKTKKAFEFVMKIANSNCEKIAIENPIGCISTKWRKPDQIIQPYYFGEDASKATCLWLKNLPILKSTKYVPPRIVNGKKRWSNQTNSGQNKLGPSQDRSKIRSKTFLGIAEAMANQWSEQMNDRQWICKTHQNLGKKGSLPKECTKKQGCVFNKRYIPIQTKLF